MEPGEPRRTRPDIGFETSRVGDTDAGLLARCGAAPECLGRLFDRHADSIHRYLARRVGPDDADDLLSDVFLAAYRGRATYDQSRPDARPWLYGIAANLSARQFRSRTRAAAAAAKLAARERGVAHEVLDVDRLDSQAAWPEIATALNDIPDDQRDALLLFVWEELSYDEIAAALDVPVGTVRSRIHRARTRLRELLADLRASTDAENG